VRFQPLDPLVREFMKYVLSKGGQETVVKDDKDKIGRNDPCWCGSGKK